MKYRDFLNGKVNDVNEVNDVINEEITQVNDTNIGYIISYSLFFVAQTHVWHLVTINAQQHVALGEFYDKLQDEIDELAEKFIAQGGILEPVAGTLSTYYNIETTTERMNEFRKLVTSAITTDPEMASIVDGVQDIQELIDSTLYKLNLV